MCSVDERATGLEGLRERSVLGPVARAWIEGKSEGVRERKKWEGG